MAKLQELLGDDYKDGMTVEEINSALDGRKLVDLAGGGYVSKDKYQALENELKTSQANLSESITKIAGLEKNAGDNKALTEEIAKLKADIEAQKADFELRATKRERDYISNDQIKEYGAKSVKAVKALLADVFDLDKAEIKDGKIQGLEEALKGVKESDGYLFNSVEPIVPRAGREPTKPNGVTKEEELLKLARKSAGLK